MADLYSTDRLLNVLESLKRSPLFLLNAFFGSIVEEESEEIHFDVEVKKRRVAPFVNPVREGRKFEADGFETKTFRPAYVKPKTDVDPSKPLKRMAGEQIGGGSISAAQREAGLVAMILQSHVDAIRRRKEIMAAEALRLGTVTVTGDGYPTVVVDFGRTGTHTKTLLGGARWGEAGVSPVADLDTWGLEMLQNEGAGATDVVLEVAAWKLLKADAEFEKIADLRRLDPSAEGLQFGPVPDHVVYRGRLGGLRLWTYQDWYVDDAGVEQPLMPAHQVLLVSRTSLSGLQQHGAIRDPRAAYQAGEFFPKTWIEEDPAVRWIMTQSAPLVVPQRPNASMGIVVR